MTLIVIDFLWHFGHGERSFVGVLDRAHGAMLVAPDAPSVRPGTVTLPKGLWRKSTNNGFTSNALVPDTLTDLGGGACFNDARVEVDKRS